MGFFITTSGGRLRREAMEQKIEREFKSIRCPERRAREKGSLEFVEET